MFDQRNLFEHLLYSLLAAVGLFVVIVSTDKFGAGVSPDSVAYVAAARSLSSGYGYLYYDGTPFTLWPPLLPTILAGGIVLGFDVIQFARVFNALTFGLTIFCIGQIALRIIDSRALRFIVATIALFSFPLLKPAVMVWSEPLFILLVLVFIQFLGQLRKTGSLSLGSVATLTGIAACACLQRYLGVVFVLCGVVSMLSSHRVRWRERIIATSGFLILSLLPLAMWIYRNHAFGGGAAGPRVPSTASVLTSLQDLLTVWTNWYLPFYSTNMARIAAFVLSVVLVTILVFVKPTQPDGVGSRKGSGFFYVAAIFVLAYCAALLAITNTIALEPISQRYLAPIFPIVLLFEFKAFEELVRLCERKVNVNRIRLLLLGLPLIILSESAITALDVISIWRREGAGDYTQADWQRSELIEWLAKHPLNGQFYSNAADFMYLKTGLVVHSLPSRGADLKFWRERMNAGDKHYATWFTQSFRTYIYTPVEVSEAFKLMPIFLGEKEALFELK